MLDASELNTRRIPPAAAILTIIAVAFFLYASTLGHGFIFIWDDYKYVVNNSDVHGFSSANLKAVFSNYYVGNYAPLHLISYMCDYQLWGLDPLGYHFSNIAMHALNGILVYRLFTALEIPAGASLFGAVLFVAHPVQVESVAWVSERKNLISAAFFLLALLSYINYRNRINNLARDYSLSLIFFTCALLSKSAAVIFPLVIASYDLCYKRGGPGRLKIIDKLPFLFLSLAAGILAVLTQNRNAHINIGDYPGGTPTAAVWTMIPVFISYVGDLVCPFDLSPYYMVPVRRYIDTAVLLSIFVFVCMIIAGVRFCRRDNRMAFFTSIYVLSLLPVMQFIPIISTLKNDRYLYFPMIGAAGAAAIAASFLLRQDSGGIRNATAAIAVIVCVVLGSTAYRQSLIWKDNISLWKHALKQNPENMLAWLMLAKGYTKAGNSVDALAAINAYSNLKMKYGPLRGWEGEW